MVLCPGRAIWIRRIVIKPDVFALRQEFLAQLLAKAPKIAGVKKATEETGVPNVELDWVVYRVRSRDGQLRDCN